MDNVIELTAVLLKLPDGYVGFVEELPGVNSHGRTLAEARDMLGEVAAIAFDAERRRSRSSSPTRTACASRSRCPCGGASALA